MAARVLEGAASSVAVVSDVAKTLAVLAVAAQAQACLRSLPQVVFSLCDAVELFDRLVMVVGVRISWPAPLYEVRN